MRREPQPQLFVLARELTDAERTVLEALDAKGTLTTREVGRIVYRLHVGDGERDDSEALAVCGDHGEPEHGRGGYR